MDLKPLSVRLFKLADRIHNKRPILDVLKDVVAAGNPLHTMLHFTNDRDLFGVNPKYEWKNPNGIYGYLVNSKNLELLERKTNALYGIDRKYCIVFHPRSPSSVLDLAQYTDSMFKRDKAKLLKLAKPDAQRSIKNGEYLKRKYEKTDITQKFGSGPAVKLWLASWCVAGYNANAWNKVLRQLGYTGVVDTAGTGLIHPNEPYQGFLLNSSCVAGNHELYNNPFNKRNVEEHAHGKFRHIGFVLRPLPSHVPDTASVVRLKKLGATCGFQLNVGSTLASSSRFVRLSALQKYLGKAMVKNDLARYTSATGAPVFVHRETHMLITTSRKEAVAFARQVDGAVEDWLRASDKHDLVMLREPRGTAYALADAEDDATQQLEAYARYTKKPGHLKTLAKHKSRDVRLTAACNKQAPAEALRYLAKDADEDVRHAVAAHANTPIDALDYLVDDASMHEILARRRNLPMSTINTLIHNGNTFTRVTLAWNDTLPAAALEQLSYEKSERILNGVAQHPNTPVKVLEAMFDNIDFANGQGSSIAHHLARNPKCPVSLLERLAKLDAYQYRDAVYAAKEKLGTGAKSSTSGLSLADKVNKKLKELKELKKLQKLKESKGLE